MSTAHDSKTDTEKRLAACIFASDKIVADCIREFFESYECVVYLNSDNPPSHDYSIVCGNSIFVKNILSKYQKLLSKPLIIVDHVNSQELEDIKHTKSKIVVIGKLLDIKKYLRKIFNFYITERNQILELSPITLFEKSEQTPKKEVVTKSIINTVKPLKVYKPKQDFKKENVADFHVLINHKIDFQEGDRKRISHIIDNIYQTKKQAPTKKRKYKIFQKLIFVICVLTLPVILFFATLMGSLINYGNSLYFFAKGHETPARIFLNISKNLNSNARSIYKIATYPFLETGLNVYLSYYESFLLVYSDIEEATDRFYYLSADLNEFVSGFNFVGSSNISTNENILVTLNRIKTNIPFITDRLKLSDAQLKFLFHNKKYPLTIPFVSSKLYVLEKQMAKVNHYADMAGSLIDLFSTIGGFGSPQTHLVLFQNSMELRPGGGFIGSIGKITFDNGQISRNDIFDVYTLDGQLKGHSDPPKPIKDILSQEHWYLRDSNWSSDFEESAVTAKWFYEKEMGDTVSSVIAINTPFIINILRTTGPIHLKDFNDTISADNFFGKALYYTEEKYFPGSTQKKNFLTSLCQELMAKVSEFEKSQYVSLLQSLATAVDAKDIQFYSDNNEVENMLIENNLAGSTRTYDYCPKEGNTPCNQYWFYPVEANLGVNKVNYFVKEKRYLELNITADGNVNFKSIFKLNNGSDEVSKMGGDYQSYFQIPERAEIVCPEYTFNGNQMLQNLSQEKQPAPYWEYPDSNNKNIGIYISTGPKKESDLTLKCRFTKNIVFESKQTKFKLILPKQPGLTDIDQSLVINFPDIFKVTDISGNLDPLLENKGQLQYNTKITKDIVIEFILNK
jgi:hypothetical protein